MWFFKKFEKIFVKSKKKKKTHLLNWIQNYLIHRKQQTEKQEVVCRKDYAPKKKQQQQQQPKFSLQKETFWFVGLE